MSQVRNRMRDAKKIHLGSSHHRPRRVPARAVILVMLLVHGNAAAQQLTIERIFSPEFTARHADVTFAPDGRRLVRLESAGSGTNVWVEPITGGNRERLIDGAALVPPGQDRALTIEGLSWSADGNRALIFTNSERVWRANTRGTYYIWDRLTSRLVPASSRAGGQMFAKLSPDAALVAFVRDNNLFVADPFSAREIRVTADGGHNIINGTSDWVYEEELNLRDAFRWSPDGKRIAFWRFDQSAIDTFFLTDELALYPRLVPVRYPKAGTSNSRVEIRVANIATGHTVRIDAGADSSAYLARMEWLGADSLVIQRLNRRQNRLDVLIASATTGQSRVLLSEQDSAWVDVDDDLTWLRDGRRFLWTSERDGFNHIYLYSRSGALIRQLTRGEWDVLQFHGVSDGGLVFFTASERGPAERHLYTVGLDARGFRRVTIEPGVHDVQLAPGGRYFIDHWSRADAPPTARLHAADGRLLTTLAENKDLGGRLEELKLRGPEFFQFSTTDGVSLNGWMIKPADFDSTRSYPVLLYVYGGPGSQTVTDSWGGSSYLWHQLLAKRGIVVVSVDNRGTGARGRAFKKISYLELGRWEANDQIETARFLASLPWVDARRIGIWGWSFGGFLTTLSMSTADVFRAGIAVAPVTDWRLYDTIYTERFMRTPAENPRGYDETSPLARATRLQGRLLLVHGTGDDNVHFQNSLHLSNALQAAGKTFDLMVYANRTHSISGGNTSVHLYSTMTDWLIRHLASVP